MSRLHLLHRNPMHGPLFLFQGRIGRRSARLSMQALFRREQAIPTHMTAPELLILWQLARRTSPSVIVEIGSYLGASANFLAAGVGKRQPAPRIYCIDTWNNDAMTEGPRDTYQDFLANTSHYRNLIRTLRMQSHLAADAIGDQVDLLFIDGDHSYEAVSRDLAVWLPKLSAGGLVILHDIAWAPGVQQAVAEQVEPRASYSRQAHNLYWAKLA